MLRAFSNAQVQSIHYKPIKVSIVTNIWLILRVTRICILFVSMEPMCIFGCLFSFYLQLLSSCGVCLALPSFCFPFSSFTFRMKVLSKNIQSRILWKKDPRRPTHLSLSSLKFLDRALLARWGYIFHSWFKLCVLTLHSSKTTSHFCSPPPNSVGCVAVSHLDLFCTGLPCQKNHPTR